MLCNLCSKNQATVHLTEIVDDQMNELHLCDECARKKSMQMEQQFGLSDLLAGLVDYGKQFGAGAEKGALAVQCGFCGLTYEDFRKIGRLGCSECYGAFAKYLGPLLKRIHGADKHAGKLPGEVPVVEPRTQKARATNVAELKEKLQQAIEHEEFEDAARLRDEIKEMELKIKEGEKSKESKKKKS
jgi:protein arginine kinase activator